jgi:hypothetical protein
MDISSIDLIVWNSISPRTGYDLINVLPTEQGFTMDPKIKDPYYDQFSVGIERELLTNFSMGATFIYKNGKNSFGYEDRGGIYEQVQRTSSDNGQTYTVWNLVGGKFDYWLTNPKAFGQTYKGLILQFNKRYSNRWLLNASATWSKAEGLILSARSNNGYGMSQSLVWYTGQFGRDPNDLINAKGVMNLDKTWMIKVSAGYNFPWDIFLSFNYAFTTGRPTLKNVRIPDLDQPYVVTIQAEEKGKVRFKDEHFLNVRVEKAFTLYKSVRLRAMVDVFNLLNDATVTRWVSNDTWKDTYQLPSWIPDPRRVQLGLKLEF